MKLSKLLEKIEYSIVAGDVDVEISTLVYDSRKVEKGSVFVCISGAVRDAHDFIPDVVEMGATAVIVEKDVAPIDGITYIKVSNTRLALACMAAAYFDYPAAKLKTIAITGAKGKTTTTYMILHTKCTMFLFKCYIICYIIIFIAMSKRLYITCMTI